MGLNLNYTLLKEGSNSYFKIPEYRQMDSRYNVYSNNYVLEQISQFNQVMREASIELTNISINNEYITEASFFNNVITGISTIIRKVVDALKKIVGIIINAFMELYRKIKDKFSKKDPDIVEKKYRQNERIKFLRKALYQTPIEEKTLLISDIKPTEELMDKNFPDSSLIGSKLVNLVKTNLDNFIYKNIHQYARTSMVDDNIDPSTVNMDIEANESLADVLEDQKEEILSKMLGKYSYDATTSETLSASINSIGIKAFGDISSIKATPLTEDLYLLALDNLTRGKELANSIIDNIKIIKTNYDEIIKSFNKAESDIKAFKPSRNTESINSITSNRLINSVSRIIGNSRYIIMANMDLLNYKRKRINQIFGGDDSGPGDSYKVKRFAHNLILKQIGMEDEISENYSPLDDTLEADILREQFESILIMTEEYWLDNEFNSRLTQYLTEDDTGAATPNVTSGTGAAKADSTQTTVTTTANIGNTNTKVAGAPNFIDKFNAMFERFKTAVQENLIKLGDTNFWNRNRGKIRTLEFGSTTVSDWKNYDFTQFEKRLNTIKYDDNAEYLNTDEGMQNEILKKFDAIPNDQRFGENDTFSQKMTKVFYTNMIPKDKPTPIAQAGFKREQTFKFVDEIVRNGFNGATFGNIKEDRKFINESYKQASQNKQATADKVADTQTDYKAQTMEQNATPKVNESATYDSDFKFNLAEHFGLVTGERIINFNEAQYNIGADDAQNSQGGAGAGIKEANARVNRYFKFMTFALSAKMTSALAAYKQYMGLYKAAYKKPKANNNESNNQQQQQNQNQQQNNQQQAQQQPTAEGQK